MKNFYCKYCDTTKYLKVLRGRVTCGANTCIGYRQNELARERRKLSKKKNKDTSFIIYEKPKKEVKGKNDLLLIPTAVLNSAGQENKYEVDSSIIDAKGCSNLFLLGVSYEIDTDNNDNRFVITKPKRGHFLVFLNREVQIRDKSHAFKFGRVT